MTKLKLIKKITSDWFQSHAFVNEVYWGDFIRWYADKEIQHSCVVTTPIRVTEVTRSKRAIQLQITYADRVFGDFRNLDDVHSDADRVLSDFILSASNDKEIRKYLTGLTSGNIEYFTNRTGDLVAGATMSVNINVFSDANNCEIPVDFKPQPTPFVCQDASYKVIYENGTLIEQGTIPSGGSVTVEVPDTPTCDSATWELRDTDNNLLDSGSIVSGGSATIIAPNGTVSVQNSQGNTVDSGVVLSGGSEVFNAPDANISLNGISFPSIPSGGSDNIQVRQENTSTQIGTQQGQYWRIADSPITVNSDAYTDLPATDSLNIPIVDSNGDPVATTIIGSDVVVDDLPCAGGVTRSTATLMKTGQTISYATGDDGDLQAGRDTDFFTLDSAPIHNDGSPTINTTTNRFTDTLGGQNYANDIVLDWSTWNGSTLLGYYQSLNDFTFDLAIADALSLNIGGFLGWRMQNLVEQINIMNKQPLQNSFQYPSPWNSLPIQVASSQRRFWNSTQQSSTHGLAINNNSLKTVNRLTKTSISHYHAVRTFSLSTSNILS